MKKRILLAVLSLVFALGAVTVFSACPPVEPPCNCTMADLFLFNPYRNVDFSTFGRHKADFHVHTSNSDGTASPDETARRFRSLGFDFLAIAEHDWTAFTMGRHPSRLGVTVNDGVATAGEPTIPNFNAGSNNAAWVQTWPWSRFGVEQYYSDTHYSFRGGLIPIQANEVTRTQHFGNFHTSFTDQTVFGEFPAGGSGSARHTAGGMRSVMTRAIAHSRHYYPCERVIYNLPTIQDGQVRFEIFHPERDIPGHHTSSTPTNIQVQLAHLDLEAVDGVYPFLSAGYYQALIRDFPTILSMEVFNQTDRHPSRHIYDRVMRGMFPERPVWLSANSDEHGIYFGQSANIMLLENRTEHDFRLAREQGAYFAVSFGNFNPNYLELDYDQRYLADTITNAAGHHWTHDPHTEPRLSTQRWGDRWNYVPNIQDIIIDCCAGYITVVADTYTRFLWITEDGVEVGNTNTINFRTNDRISNFVRGELRNYTPDGTLISSKLMQPFGVGTFNPDSWFFHFTGLDVTVPPAA